MEFTQDMVSPLKYELVISQLNLAEIFLMIFKEYSNEMRKIKIAKQQQTSIQKVPSVIPITASVQDSLYNGRL